MTTLPSLQTLPPSVFVPRQNQGDCSNSAQAAINATTVAASRSIQQAQATAAHATMQISISVSAVNEQTSKYIALANIAMSSLMASASSVLLSAQNAVASASASVSAIAASVSHLPTATQTAAPKFIPVTQQSGIVFPIPAQIALLVVGSVLASVLLTLAISCLIIRPRRKAASKRELDECLATASADRVDAYPPVSRSPSSNAGKRSKPLTSSAISSNQRRSKGESIEEESSDSFSRFVPLDARTSITVLTARLLVHVTPTISRAIQVAEMTSARPSSSFTAPLSRTRLFIPPSPGSSLSDPVPLRQQAYQYQRSVLSEVVPWEEVAPSSSSNEEDKDKQIRVETEIEVRLRNRDSSETLRMAGAY
ncbi:hypothetical protein BDZ45DRAFT_752066 [Acephala macrosclerotiorum]|nr:hypothetical protein BDZ45DRAFT_752066 [Acephala macrosclerotiorum]